LIKRALETSTGTEGNAQGRRSWTPMQRHANSSYGSLLLLAGVNPMFASCKILVFIGTFSV